MTKFEEATERSQQAGNIKDQSHLQRMGNFAKLFTMFTTSQNQYYRITSSAIRNMYHGRGSKAEHLKALFIANALLPTVFSVIAAGVKWDDDDVLKSILQSPFAGIMIVKDITDAAWSGLIKGKAWSPQTPLLSIGNDALEAYYCSKQVHSR